MFWALARRKKRRNQFASCDELIGEKKDVEYILPIYLDKIWFESQGSYD